MAVTNGWGQAAKNNTNGYGKLATNNIGAGSIYEDSYAGDTALIGVSAAFSYSASSFTQADSNPTPTITGTTGGTFSGTSGLVFVSTSTGEINLSASTIAAHVVTYTVDGVSSDFSLSVTAAPFANQFSFEFDGVDENLGLDATFNVTGGLTLSCWIKYDASNNSLAYWITNGALGGTGNIITTRFSGNSWFNLINGSPVYTGVTGLGDNNWHHIAQTINYSNGDVKYYKDGVQSSNTYTFGSAMTTAIIKNIGAQNNSGASAYNGLIDEFAVFESIVNISDLYNSGKPGDLNSLSPALWLRMGEEATFSGGNWTLTDQGSGGNNATSNNMEEADRKADTP